MPKTLRSGWPMPAYWETEMTITNVHVDCVNHDLSRAALGWEKGGFRFHVWFTIKADGSPDQDSYDTVFKNPIQRGPGHRTIHMRHNSGPNAKMLNAAWRTVDEQDLIGRAVAAAKDAEAKRLREAEAEASVARKRYHGPLMYDVLVAIREHAKSDNIITASLHDRIEEAILQAETGEGYAYAVG